MAMLPPTPSLNRAARRVAVAVGVAALAALAVRAERSRRRRRPRRNTELAAADRATVEGVAAELVLRGVRVRVGRFVDLTREPGVELFTLDYPASEERRVQKHLAVLHAAGVAPGLTGVHPD